MHRVPRHAQGHPGEGGGGDLDGKLVELPAPVDQGDEGPGHHHQPRRHGQDKEQAGPEGLPDGILKSPRLPSGGEAGEFWEDDVGDRQDEHPRDDQVEVGGVLQRRHPRPAVEPGAVSGVDGLGDGLYPGGDHHRTHQNKDLFDALRPELEAGPQPASHSDQGGQEDGPLQKPAQQIGRRQPVDAEPPVQSIEVADDDQVGHGGHEGGGGEVVLGLEHPHQGEGQPGEEHRGEHHPGEGDRQIDRFRLCVVRKKSHQGLGEGHPRQGQPAGEQGDEGQKAPGEAEGLLPALFGQILAEYRDKAGGNGAGQHRVKKHPGDAAGGKEGAGLHAGVVVDGQQPVPVEPQHLADERDGHDQADGLGRALFLVQPRRPLPKKISKKFQPLHFTP